MRANLGQWRLVLAATMPHCAAQPLQANNRDAKHQSFVLFQTGCKNLVDFSNHPRPAHVASGIMKGKRVKTVGKGLYAAALLMAAAGFSVGAKAGDEGSLAKGVTLPDGSMTQEGSKDVNGKWTLPDGSPTYRITTKDGKIDKLDWYAYSGFRRYHAECHVCHGPEGEGSTYAPALAKSLQTMTYGDFLGVVASGRVRNEAGTEYVMPALGDNKNVMCYVDDIYIYLKARSTGAMPRGRPPGRDDKPPQAVAYDKQCLGE